MTSAKRRKESFAKHLVATERPDPEVTTRTMLVPRKSVRESSPEVAPMTTMKMSTKKRQTKRRLLRMLPNLPRVKVKQVKSNLQQYFRMIPIPMKEFATVPVIWDLVKTNSFQILI